MKTNLKIWYNYFIRGQKKFKFAKKIQFGHTFGGYKLHIQTYEVVESSKFIFPIIKISCKNNIYWKPFKIYISEEALPNITERNTKGNSEFTNIWFEVNDFNGFFDIKIIDKIKLDDVLTGILNNFIKNVQTK